LDCRLRREGVLHALRANVDEHDRERIGRVDAGRRRRVAERQSVHVVENNAVAGHARGRLRHDALVDEVELGHCAERVRGPWSRQPASSRVGTPEPDDDRVVAEVLPVLAALARAVLVAVLLDADLVGTEDPPELLTALVVVSGEPPLTGNVEGNGHLRDELRLSTYTAREPRDGVGRWTLGNDLRLVITGNELRCDEPDAREHVRLPVNRGGIFLKPLEVVPELVLHGVVFGVVHTTWR